MISKTSINLIALIFIPSFVYVISGTSSLSLGLLCVFLLIIYVQSKSLDRLGATRSTILVAIAGCLILLRSVADVLLNPSFKSLVSIILLFLLVCTSWLFASGINRLSDRQLIKLFHRVAIICMFVLIIFGFNKVKMLNYSLYPANIFPFSEPSHFAISCGPIFAVAAVVCNRKMKFTIVAAVIAAALYLPSLTLLMIGLMITFLLAIQTYKLSYFVFLLLTILGCILTLVSAGAIAIQDFMSVYFTERINVTSSENLSALVYLQGWERAFLGVSLNYGMGAGFQDLSSLQVSNSSEIIYNILNRYKNIDDGGFVFAKIVGEFGLLGMVFAVSYIWTWLRMIIYLSKVYYSTINKLDPNLSNCRSNGILPKIVGSVLFTCFIVEFLVRGVGYFSPGVFLFLVGLFLLLMKQKKKIGSIVSDI